MTLQDNIHRLTREHLTKDKDGVLRALPALLAELRLAVIPGRNSTGNGGAEGAPIPIDPTALDMLGDIEKEARKDYAELTGEAWTGDLESLVQQFANMFLITEWHTYLVHVTTDWVDSITAYLWPVKPRRKLVGVVCPSCGWATYGEERKTCLTLGCWDSEGNMRKTGDWDIECSSCEAAWSGQQVAWLLRTLDTPKEDVANVS